MSASLFLLPMDPDHHNNNISWLNINLTRRLLFSRYTRIFY
jgi:hypothetical protein